MRKLSSLIGAAVVAVSAAAVVLAVASPAAAAAPPSAAVSLSPSSVEPGRSVHVDVTLYNGLDFPITDVKAGLSAAQTDITTFTTLTACSAAGGCNAGFQGFKGYTAFLRRDLAPGESATVGFDLLVSPQAPTGEYVLRGELFGGNYAFDPVTGPTLTIQTSADVAVGITATPKIGLLESSVGLKVAVRNSGPGVAQQATVSVKLPRGAGATSPDCTVADGTATCVVTNVPVGGTATASLTMPVRLLALGPQVFTATRTASTPRDPDATDDTASARCTVVSRLLITC